MKIPLKHMTVACTTCGQPRQAIDGASLRAARQSRKLSQRQLASQVGYTASYISDLERNRRPVSPRIVAAYQEALK